MWRLVLDKVASLEELNNHYTLVDIWKANALLDMRAAVKAQQEAKRK